MKGLLKNLLDVCFPDICHICDVRLAPHERFVCTGCLSSLPRTGYHRLPLNPMEERFAGLFPFRKATSLFFYTKESALSTLIQDMKYRNFPDIGTLLGKMAGEELFSTGFFNDIDVIVPLPMHYIKKWKRGYNQVDMIAGGLSKATGIPVVPILKMKKGRKTQTSLSRQERLENASDLFTVGPKYKKFEGKNILLLDDVCTTGATISSAALALHDDLAGIQLSLLTIGVTF